MGKSFDNTRENEAVRRFEIRRGIERICEEADKRDKAERLLDMRIRYGALKGSRIA